ncbi:MFS transporter [Sphingomonas canadensis]|nr:MFS transporter [Sphingomonas canadensis]
MRTIIALALTYALLGILMNSVGAVILQSIRHFGATRVMGSSLEACKDLSVVAASFLLATRVPAFGYRNALIAVLATMAAACLAASFASGFLAMQLLFVVTGLGFGVAKIATYSTIGLLARDPAGHASLTGTIEGVFMVGVLSGAWLFGWFIAGNDQGGDWLRVYWLLAGLCAAGALLWRSVVLDERDAVAEPGGVTGWREMATLALLPATVTALIALFLYVLIEQGVGTWLPSFNREVLQLQPALSVQMSSIFLAALALGRLTSGYVLRRLDWLPVLLACLAAIALIVVATLPLARPVAPGIHAGWFEMPVAAYLFPLLGIFLAPIYPTICSAALSALPPHRHAAMVGLIVIFSALGGTIGSLAVAMLFQHVSGELAFYFVLVPIALIALLLPMIRKRQDRSIAA